MYLAHNKWIWMLGLAIIAVALALLPPHTVAAADTGGYPYAGKPCVHAPYAIEGTAVQWCQGYDWGDVRDDTSAANVISPYGYYYRNCTDYVAWRLAGLGVAPAQYKGLGNAKEWAQPPAGNGLTVDSVPAVGAAAVRTGGTYGHVAFVEAVQADGTITVAQYNKHGDGTFSIDSGMPAALGFTVFVHLEAHIPQAAASTTTLDTPEVEPEPQPEAEAAVPAVSAEVEQPAPEQAIAEQIPPAPRVMRIDVSSHQPTPVAEVGPTPVQEQIPEPAKPPQPAATAAPPARPVSLFTPATAVPARWWQQPASSPPSIGFAPAAGHTSYWPLLGLIVLCIAQAVWPVKMFTARSP
jgi:surface antigen